MDKNLEDKVLDAMNNELQLNKVYGYAHRGRSGDVNSTIGKLVSIPWQVSGQVKLIVIRKSYTYGGGHLTKDIIKRKWVYVLPNTIFPIDVSLLNDDDIKALNDIPDCVND